MSATLSISGVKNPPQIAAGFRAKQLFSLG